TEGEIGIMPGHEPVLGQLIEGGTVSITSVDGERIVAAVHGGFLSVTATTVTILAESADMAQDIDVEAAKAVLAENSGDLEAIAVAKGQLRAVERA
ncbi:F0F1 ATP synthase subunit epsilon, partial [Rhodococcus sp. EPR-134]